MTDGDFEPADQGKRRWTFAHLVGVVGIMASIAGIVVAAVTVLEWAESRPKTEPPGRPDAAVKSSATSSGEPSVAPSVAPSASRAVLGDDRFLQVGQCVRNLGDAKSPILKIVDCGPGMLRVVAKVEQMFNQDSEGVADAEADAACEKLAPGYTDYYFSDWTPDSSRSVVFCVRLE